MGEQNLTCLTCALWGDWIHTDNSGEMIEWLIEVLKSAISNTQSQGHF